MPDSFTIRSDDQYSTFTEVMLLTRFLSAMSELKATGPCNFVSTTDDWFTIVLVHSDSSGNFASIGESTDLTNCVTVSASSSCDAILSVLNRIAGHLDWELVDNGNVNSHATGS